MTVVACTSNAADPLDADAPSYDRLWAINTRHLTSETCRADLEHPSFVVSRLSCNGRRSPATLDHYLEQIADGRTTVMYVHGNRLESHEAIQRALTIYNRTRPYRRKPVNWVVWNWPSAKDGFLISDFRRKAVRTDAQGLYLSWILRRHAESNVPTTLIGYSFGARVITGALHALAGGRLGGRAMPQPPVNGVRFDAGLVAPAIESDWMGRRGQHRLATQNLDRLLLLYNRRDAVLKRYWLLDRVHGAMALGYTGPRSFAPRTDGTRLSLIAQDCSASVGTKHAELEYYQSDCRAGSKMASLIHDAEVTH